MTQTLSVFVRMMRSDTPPDNFTLPSLIKACSRGRSILQGMALQGLAVRFGLDRNVFLNTGLVDLYGKCMDIASARKVFDEMPERNEVSWTAMVVGYVNAGEVGEARKMFDQMPRRNVATWNVMIGGFLRIGDLVGARKMFDEMPERNVVSFTVLIDGYAKAGDMAAAKALFEESPEIDVFAWSALISGYAQNGQPNEAVQAFFELCSTNVKPDEFILTSVMSACSQLKNLELAKWIDSYVGQSSIDHCRPHILAALIDMNAKCGNMERASWLFDKMPNRDLVTYCSMIQGLSMHGRGVEAVSHFARMLDEGLTPDEVSFTVVLSACSHAGLVNEGCYYFDAMRKRYSMVPSPNHYACMVDLLGRSGNTKAAYELLKSMPVEPHAAAWGALLGACQLYYDVELAKEIGRHLSWLESLSASNYVALSNIYAAADKWLDVMNLRNEMKARGLRKIPGWTWH